MPFIIDLETREITEMLTFPMYAWLESASFNIKGTNNTLDIEGHINKAETFIIVKTRDIAYDVRYYIKRGGKCVR